jgi:hypothetical protein
MSRVRMYSRNCPGSSSSRDWTTVTVPPADKTAVSYESNSGMFQVKSTVLFCVAVTGANADLGLLARGQTGRCHVWQSCRSSSPAAYRSLHLGSAKAKENRQINIGGTLCWSEK